MSLFCRKFGIPVVPHVGDMGHDALFLEHIPHLREPFVHPCRVEGGVYLTPQETGEGSDLIAEARCYSTLVSKGIVSGAELPPFASRASSSNRARRWAI